MLKMLILVALAIATAVGVALAIIAVRERQRRRLSRARREGEYADRRSKWSSYVSLNKSRRVQRITDQRQSGD